MYLRFLHRYRLVETAVDFPESGTTRHVFWVAAGPGCPTGVMSPTCSGGAELRAQTPAGNLRTCSRVPRAAELNGRHAGGMQEGFRESLGWWERGHGHSVLHTQSNSGCSTPVPGMPTCPGGRCGRWRSTCSDARRFHGDTEQRMP